MIGTHEQHPSPRGTAPARARMSTVAVIGVGRVGSTFAHVLASSGLVRRVLVADESHERAEGEAMDIGHAMPFHLPVQVLATPLDEVRDADVVVVTAGAAQRPGEDRPALLSRNSEIVRRLVERLAPRNPGAVLLLATNPVDTLTRVALQASGLPEARVIGSGTLLDTARLRSELATRLALDARNVHGYVLGEHGDTGFIAWSAASVGNLPLADYCARVGVHLDREAIAHDVRCAAYEIIRRKGATNFAIAAALARITEAIVRDENSVLTVSLQARGQYGLGDVCLSLPAVVGRQGVKHVLPLPLEPVELAALQRSAAAVQRLVAQAG